jgi:hypothetical protein
MRKPNSNAVLKTLPDERQATIAQYARDHSLEETAKWLGDDGIKTSTGALSNFLSWHSLQQQLSRNASTVETLLAEALKANPNWTPAQIEQAGQAFFSALALEQQDPKQWFFAQQLALKKQGLEFDQAKFLESKKDGQVRALEGCLEESKQFPDVQALFRAAFAALKKAKAARK